jgi:hypothetical protein
MLPEGDPNSKLEQTDMLPDGDPVSKQEQQCTRALDALMDQVRNILPEGDPNSKQAQGGQAENKAILPEADPSSRQGERDQAESKAYWDKVRAQLKVEDEEIPWPLTCSPLTCGSAKKQDKGSE